MDRLTQLRLFVALGGHGSYAEAARSIGVPRGQISRAVQALEARLAVQLVHRSTRAVRLTAAGEAYAERAGALLHELEATDAALTGGLDRPAGELRIAAARNLGEEHLAPLLARFLADHPDVRVRLTLRDRPVRLVEEGFDLALRVAAFEDSELVARRLSDCAVLLCASPGYLAAHGRPATPADLADHRCLVDTNYAMGSRWRFEAPGGATAVAVTPVATCNSPDALRTFLRAGLGIGLSNTLHVGRDLAEGRLERVLPEHPLAVRSTIFAVYPSRRFLSAALRALLGMLERELPARLAP